MMRVHGTCIAVSDVGVVLRGPSGSGKSDLALRMIDGGARLIADDHVLLDRRGDRLLARPPETIAGMIEVRGLGVMRLDHAVDVAVGLIVDLVAAEKVERLPEPACCRLLDLDLPLIEMAAFEASAAAKLRLAVKALKTPTMRLS